MEEEYKVMKKDGREEVFDEEKMYDSVYYPAREAEVSEEEANDIGEKVIWEVKSWMSDHEDNTFTTEELREKAIEVLRRQDSDVCFMYKTHLDLN